MTTFDAYPTFEPSAHGIRLNDRVSVPDGRVGSVIGFYRRADESVLVLFDSGDSVECVLAELGVEALLLAVTPAS